MRSLRHIAEEMHDYRRSRNFSPYTESRLRPMLKLFFEFLESRFQIEAAIRLRVAHLHAYQKHLARLTNHKGLPLKPGSLNNRVKAVKALAEFMRARGYASVDLAKHLEYVKEPKLLATSVLDHKRIRRLIRQVDTAGTLGRRDRAILELLYSSGLRNGELIRLTVESVDLETGTMRVFGKGGKERVAPIGRTASRWLTAYIRGIRPFIEGADARREVFLNKNGGPLKGHTLRKIVKKYAGKAGLETVVTPHTFRRSCATEMIRGNANIYHVKELLGHENLEHLKSYTKLTINDLRETHAKCHPREKDEL